MRTKILAVDIDGTLLNHDREIHPRNIAAIQRASEKGIRVTLASGRISASVRQFTQLLGMDEAMICSNGGHVQGPDGSELLHIGLSREAVESTLEYTLSVGVHTSAYTRDQLYFLTESKWCDVYRNRVRVLTPKTSTPSEVLKMDVLKIILIDEPSRIKKHRIELEKRLDRSLASLTESEPEYLEVLSPHANKGKGLQALSESLGIVQAETAAIGDYLNDYEMVQWAGIGAAMGNAEEAVKSIADRVVATNDDGGVADFIDFLIARNELAMAN